MKKYLLSLLLIIVLSGLCTASEYNTRIPLPGNTAANTKLQYDTLMPVYMAVGTKIKNCERMAVVNTKVTKEPYDLKYQSGRAIAGKWEEVWYVNACQKQFEVPIQFVLDSMGATYIISPNNIRVKY